MPRKYKPATTTNKETTAQTGKRLHVYVALTLLERLERYLADTGAGSMSAVIVVAIDEFLRSKGY